MFRLLSIKLSDYNYYLDSYYIKLLKLLFCRSMFWYLFVIIERTDISTGILRQHDAATLGCPTVQALIRTVFSLSELFSTYTASGSNIDRNKTK